MGGGGGGQASAAMDQADLCCNFRFLDAGPKWEGERT